MSGPFSTSNLDRAAARFRQLGRSPEVIARQIYRPFIVMGPAEWTNTWHAPRYAGGFHLHEGQDVFCKYGAPVIAAMRGTLEFGSNDLGGQVAYIRFPDGGFLYYAHLSAYRDGWDGREVRPGDVIGYCGNSGDAIYSPPHVHFGIYDAQGVAHDPMAALAGWLRQAEDRANVLPRDRGGDLPFEVPNETEELGAPATGPPDVPVEAWSAMGVIANEPHRTDPWMMVAFAVAALIPLTLLGVAERRRTSAVRERSSARDPS